jgi:bleomycin hydrolase
MKAKKLLFILFAAAVLTACRQQAPEHTFTHEVLLPMTPVKNQGKTELCWAYAMLATIETEHLLRGDSINLSAQYIGRMLPEYHTSMQSHHHGQRAMGQTLLNIMARHGIVGYDVMPDDASPDLPLPRFVFLLGARYTPREFAHSLCAPDEYVSLTCCADSPYYKKIEVPIPDNWEHNRLLNVPKDSLRRHVNRALRNRHPVCWESRGHAMAIVGMARDERQRAYYVMKNSWGSDQPYGGLVYMPVSQVWRDVVAVYMTREAYNF